MITTIYAGTRITGPHGDNYRLCTRCGHDLGPKSFMGACFDCRSLDRDELHPTRQQPYPASPYTVTVHISGYPTSGRNKAILEPFHAAQLRHNIVTVEEDPSAHHYATDVLDHYTWPVVTITRGAELVDHWEGVRPERIAAYAPEVAAVAA